ncbi:putative periplasmic serine endoprotease DegP-like precursor [Botrimarina colliarenosi]|uniref:Putative periplasmic serine endoprotease DegP-like n=1 Tax=Botrimarina colliarenosi TaxID=2528001 RepID=A0A5C6A4M5_9BACT|nr:trypsin-like peptidase domain-containing protein [Botrimarina colliarenosi]TWT94061.1 putative periplasmic serine endoprotease DegP-like precursor [Botrimarina colliarenosi]
MSGSSITPRWLLATVLASGVTLGNTAAAHAAPEGASATEGAAVLAAIESSLVDLIDRCERSVVSITRYSEPPELAGAAISRGGNQILAPGPGQPRIFIGGRQMLPAGLGNLQQVPEPTPLASGAGVVIDSAGLVLTQFGVVQQDATHVVTDVDGNRYLADLRAADARSGLAVLAISKRLAPEPGDKSEPIQLPALPIGEAETLRKGRLVVSIGNPFAIESDGQPTASWGSITNTAAKLPPNEPLTDLEVSDGRFRETLHRFGSLIQTDARLGWNASGGALVMINGDLVGITTTASTIAGHEQPAGYAIPLNAAMRRAVEALSAGREPEYGLLGVSFNRGVSRNPKTGRVGIGVSEAYQGCPAQVAGLQTGDLLLSIAGALVRSPEALQLLVGSLPPGDKVEVSFERAGDVNQTTVVLGKAYVEGGDQIVSAPRRLWRGLEVDFATAVPGTVLMEKAREGAIDEEGCVVVIGVEEGSVSWESGVRPYSYISHVSGRRVSSPDEFYDAVRDAKDNVKLKFTKPLSATPQAALN